MTYSSGSVAELRPNWEGIRMAMVLVATVAGLAGTFTQRALSGGGADQALPQNPAGDGK